jgi:hypothetical protein
MNEREAFEAWIKQGGGDLSTFGTEPNMHYHNSAVNNAWTGWARRAALASAPAATQGEAVAYALRWPYNGRLNLSTVFDTQREAEDYAAQCQYGAVVVPLYAGPHATASADEDHALTIAYMSGFNDAKAQFMATPTPQPARAAEATQPAAAEQPDRLSLPAKWVAELLTLCGPEQHELRDRVRASLAPSQAPAGVEAAQQDAVELTALIVRDCCETDPADPDEPSTVCISVTELNCIVRERLQAAAAAKSHPQEGRMP